MLIVLASEWRFGALFTEDSELLCFSVSKMIIVELGTVSYPCSTPLATRHHSSSMGTPCWPDFCC